MKRLIITLFLSTILLAIGLAVFSHYPSGKKFLAIHAPGEKKIIGPGPAIIHKLQLKASVAKSFVKKNDYNQEFCFLLDMSIASGQKRFFCL